MTFPRINCCIVGCRRGTTKFPPECEVICGKCWRRVPPAVRKAHREAVKERDRIVAIFDAEADAHGGVTSETSAMYWEAEAAREDTWSACRTASLLAAAGL